MSFRRCLHVTGYSLIPVRLHPSSVMSICIRLLRIELFQNEFIPVVALDRNFRSGTKSSFTFHKYNVNEVCAHSSTELSTWNGLVGLGSADSYFRSPMVLPHFHSGMSTST